MDFLPKALYSPAFQRWGSVPDPQGSNENIRSAQAPALQLGSDMIQNPYPSLPSFPIADSGGTPPTQQGGGGTPPTSQAGTPQTMTPPLIQGGAPSQQLGGIAQTMTPPIQAYNPTSPNQSYYNGLWGIK